MDEIRIITESDYQPSVAAAINRRTNFKIENSQLITQHLYTIGKKNYVVNFKGSTIPGTFVDNNGSHTISSTYNGFSLIGWKASDGEDFSTNIRWTMPINTNEYNRITFLAQMTKIHGYV